MCEFHNSNGNGFGDMWWTGKCTYFSSIDNTQYAFNVRTKFNVNFLQNVQLEDIIADVCRFPAILSDRPNSLAVATRLLEESHLKALHHLLMNMAQRPGDEGKTDLMLPAKYMSKYGFFFFRIFSHFYVGSMFLMKRLH